MRVAVLPIAMAMLGALAGGCVADEPGLTGHACIVIDPRNPALCGAQQDVGGLRVVEVTSGQETTTDGSGRFSVAIAEGTTRAVLRLADDRTDRRVSLIGVDVAPSSDVLAPVVTTVLWSTYLNALHVADDPATASVHVALSPLPGIAVGGVEVAGATQILYNQGEPFVWNEQPPGDQTPAVLAFGIPGSAGTAMVNVISRTDEVLYNGPVPVQAGAVTWVRIVR
jgi:hypothetical protein